MGKNSNSFDIEKDIKKKVFDKVILKKLGKYATHYRYSIYFIMFIILITVVCEISLPLISRYVIDSFISNTYSISSLKVESLPKEIEESETITILDSNFLAYPKGEEDKFTANIRKDLIRNRLEDQYFIYKIDEVNLSDQFKPRYKNSEYALISENSLSKLNLTMVETVRLKDLNGIKYYTALFVIVITLAFITTYIQIVFTAKTGQKIIHDIRMDLFKHMEKMPIKFFDTNPTGVLVTRVTNDIKNLNEFFSDVLINLFKDFFVLLGIFLVLFIADWRLAIITISVIPLIFLISFFFKRKMRNVFRWSRKALATINAILSESITGMGVIQLFNQEDREKERFLESNDNHYKASYKQMILNSFFRPTFSVLRFGTIGTVLFFSSRFISADSMTIGTLVAFIAYIEKFFQPVQEISEKINLMQSAMASSEKIFDLMEVETEDYSNDSNEYNFGEIEFKNVYFSYNDDEWVLKDFNLKIRNGESIAIVGSTGAGKTTIINILNRFYPISKGSVTIDDVDIYAIPLQKLRTMIGLVQQDLFIFSGSIKDNIVLGEEKSDEELRIISQNANSKSFIEKLPNNYNEIMKESGTNISVGEKQLIAFTRVMAFDPKLLILDEATSSVDTETEILIQRSIEKIQKNRTSIIIAHRLSTIRNCDRIVVLHKGEVKEEGSHDNLIAKGGFYYNLYKLQYE
ncbi:MAG: hypothetical protein CR982_08485 [Candidatus Cloacimonadota bacterium]|nr:MAG: hypothetical protein CR982_08485 [Candidatus Cloacimonadota bacterium]PIE78671.1 MAG: hypothetical protein CSA15_06410 [Candidatus Delongbacteria bacterium]